MDGCEFNCCSRQPSWIFIYHNEEKYGICKKHFESPSHRFNVKYVLDLKSQKVYHPHEIFEEALLATL